MNQFEKDLKELYSIPESRWIKRRELAQELIKKSIDQNSIKVHKIPSQGSNYFHILKFSHLGEEYAYLEEISPISPMPIINWFQIEKLDKQFGEHVIKTILLLSSDNEASTQLGGLFQ